MKDIRMTRPVSQSSPDNTVWIDHSERIAVITSPLPELLAEMDCARESDLTSQTFGLIVGVALGRIIERDKKAGRDSLYGDWLSKCYSRLSYWADREPAAFGVVVALTPPDQMYADLASCSKDKLDKRIFYAGLMLGRAMEEGSSYQDFVRHNPECMDELICMISEDTWWLEARE